ncbi:polyketide synthase, partial [Aureobasidium melanogenum]
MVKLIKESIPSSERSASSADFTNLGVRDLTSGRVNVRLSCITGSSARSRAGGSAEVVLVRSSDVRRLRLILRIILNRANVSIKLREVLLHLTNGRVVGEKSRADLHVKILSELGRDGQGHEGVDTKVLECSLINKLGLLNIGLGSNDLHDTRGDGSALRLLGSDLLGSLSSLDNRLRGLSLGSGSLRGSDCLGGGSGSSRGSSLGRCASLLRRQEDVQDTARDLLELETTADSNNLISLHDVNITLVNVTRLGKHADVRAVVALRSHLLGDSHRTPAVRDADVVVRVNQELGTSHLDEALEELVSHTALHDMGLLSLSLSLENIDLRLDHEVDTLPVLVPGVDVLELDETVSMVLNELAIWGDTSELQVSDTLVEVSLGLELDVLAFSRLLHLGDEGLGDLHLADVHANLRGRGSELLVEVVADSQCHVSVEGRGAKSSVVDLVTNDSLEELGLGNVGLNDNGTRVGLELFMDNLLAGSGETLSRLLDGRGSLRSSLNESSCCGSRASTSCCRRSRWAEEELIWTPALKRAQTLVAMVFQGSSLRRSEGAATVAPTEALTMPEQTGGQSGPEVDSLSGVSSEVVWANNASLANDISGQGREDRDSGLVEGDRGSNLLEGLEDRVDLGRVEGEGNIELGGLEAASGKSLVGSTNDLTTAAKDSLLRTDITDGFSATLDSEHAVSVRSAVLDKELSTTTDKGDHITGRDDTSNVESSVLAQAVTDDSGRGERVATSLVDVITERLEVLVELLTKSSVLNGEGNAVVVLNTTGSRSVRQAGKSGLGVLAEVSLQTLNVVLQGSDRTGSHSDGESASGVNSLRGLAKRTILKEDGGVTTSSGEVVEEDLALLSTVAGEVNLLLRNVDIAVLQVLGESLVDLALDTNVGRNGVLLHHHQDLAEGVDTRSGLTACAGGDEERRRCTVHLDVADLMGIDTSIGEDLLVKELLSASVRVSDRNSLSRVVGSSAKNASKDIILVGKRILVSLEDNGTTTITTAVTISSVVVSLARTCLGQELTLGKTRENVRVGKDVQTTSTGSVAVTGPQRSAGKLDGSQRRRTSSIDRERRTTELEVVVDATGCESTHTTSNEVGVNVLGSVDLTPIVRGLTVEGTNAVKLGGGGTVGDVTRLLKSLVSGDKSQTTHRISLCSLTGGHVEEARVEKTRLINKATIRSVRLVLALSRRVAVSIGIETVRGNLAVDIETLLEKFPKSLSAGSAGETTRHTNDGNLVVLSATVRGISDSRLPSRMVDERNRSLATSFDGRDEAVRYVADTNAEDFSGSVGVGGDLSMSFRDNLNSSKVFSAMWHMPDEPEWTNERGW